MDGRAAAVHYWSVMAQPEFEAVRREWFDDGRDTGRKMQASWHPREGVVILSLWHGPICAASFRLPIEDAPRLIQELVEALGSAATRPPRVDPLPARKGLTAWWHHWRRKVQAEMAEIINLSDRRR
jgi:hypothetical protein